MTVNKIWSAQTKFEAHHQFVFPQSSRNIFFTELFERTMCSALFGQSSSRTYRNVMKTMEIKVTS